MKMLLLLVLLTVFNHYPLLISVYGHDLFESNTVYQ